MVLRRYMKAVILVECIICLPYLPWQRSPLFIVFSLSWSFHTASKNKGFCQKIQKHLALVSATRWSIKGGMPWALNVGFPSTLWFWPANCKWNIMEYGENLSSNKSILKLRLLLYKTNMSGVLIQGWIVHALQQEMSQSIILLICCTSKKLGSLTYTSPIKLLT